MTKIKFEDKIIRFCRLSLEPIYFIRLEFVATQIHASQLT